MCYYNTHMSLGQIYKIHSDFYYVYDGTQSFECKVREVLKKQKERILVGDFVEFTDGFIENLERNIEIIEKDLFDIELKTLKSGSMKGKLWGGNLSSIVSLFSAEQFLPDEDIILFLEDLAEPAYKIDKMLFEIYRNKKLKEKIKGIIFGDFYLEDDEIMPILADYIEKFNVPAKLTKDITHKPNNVTIPFGKCIDL